MVSQVDVTVPPEGRATTAAVRANFAQIKSEIEVLQEEVAIKQPFSDTLSLLATGVSEANSLFYFPTESTVGTTSLTAAGRTLLSQSDARSQVAALGLNVFAGFQDQGLVVVNGGTPATQINVSATSLALFDSSGFGVRVTSVNETAAITTSGVNGLDTGSEANSTWYYVYVIFNGTTVAALLSASSVSPTLPSGYTFFRRVGSVYNNASGNFISIRKVGTRTIYEQQAVAVSGSLTQNAWTSFSISGLVPPVAKSFKAIVGSDNSGIVVGVASHSSGYGGFIGVATNVTTGSSDNVGGLLAIAVRGAVSGDVLYSGSAYYFIKNNLSLVQILGWDE